MKTVKEMSDSHYTEIEILEKINGLSQIEVIKIHKVYRTFGCEKRTGLTEQDVFQHVILKALESVGRPWPIGVSAVAFIIQTGKSHISNESERRLKLHYIPEVDDILTDENNIINLTVPILIPYSDSSLQNSEELDFFNMWMRNAQCFLEKKLDNQKKSAILKNCKI